jgi:endonuclease/exonuclease/phosphatase family metal-dependent hydrolase
MGWVMAPARHLRGSLFGNVVLSRFPIRSHLQHDLTWKTCEARNCQRVDIAVGDHTLHLYNVHLGTALLERHHQAERLAPSCTTARGHAEGRARRLQRVAARARARRSSASGCRASTCGSTCGRRRTYPGVVPVLHLDHIYYEGRVDVVKVEMPRTRLALLASDHLPLVAELKVEF